MTKEEFILQSASLGYSNKIQGKKVQRFIVARAVTISYHELMISAINADRLWIGGRRMTDNEIIKALEVCTSEMQDCEICPLLGNCDPLFLDSRALDLIDRQRAEIERLKKFLAEEEEKYKLCAKRFYKVGVKDFAERLKEKSYPFPCAIGVENAVTIRVIDDLAKEMAGDTE